MRWERGIFRFVILAVCVVTPAALPATRHESADVPKEIAPTGTVTSILEVGESGPVNNVSVELDISFIWDEDLDVYLVAPDGTRVELFTDVGNGGAGFTQTVLDDAGTVSIGDGEAPFKGRYRPEGRLGDLVGTERQGAWKLEITNDGGWFIGMLNSWAITLDGDTEGESCPPPPEAMNPDPADGATGVPTDTVLSWRLGAGAPTTFRFLIATGEQEPDPFTLFELQPDLQEVTLIDQNCGVYALDFSPDGELYGCDEYALWKLGLDAEGVSCTKIGNFRSTTDDSVMMTGLAFHPDGTLYGSTFDFLTSTSVIYTIDETTAFVTEVCRIPMMGGFIWAIDFAPDGTLYAAFVDVTLVDLETCQLQWLCTLMATDIDFAPDGFLYAVDNESRKLYQVDPSLGIIVAEYGPYQIAPWGLASEAQNGTASGISSSTFIRKTTEASKGTRPFAASSMRAFRTELQRLYQKPSQPASNDGRSYAAMAATVLPTSHVAQDPNHLTYRVFLDTISPPTTLACDNVEVRSCDPGILWPCTTYYWQVVVKNDCGEQTTGPIWSFKTESVPADFDQDCDVDFGDLAVFSSYWLYGVE